MESYTSPQETERNADVLQIMTSGAAEDVTEMLQALGDGDRTALDMLFSALYRDIHKLVHFELRKRSFGTSLQTTELLNESYVRLAQQNVRWQNRQHFFGVAVRVIRRVLVDLARKQCAQKRGSGKVDIELDEARQPGPGSTPLVDIDLALNRLSELNPRQSRVVELRFFGGLTIEETAEMLGVSSATVKREWAAARAWMSRELAAA